MKKFFHKYKNWPLVIFGLLSLALGAIENDKTKILIGVLAYIQWQIWILQDKVYNDSQG